MMRQSLFFFVCTLLVISAERRVVLVTGGSRGIGRAISRKFAESGDQVVVSYRENRQAAEELLEQLPGQGHSLAQCDVSHPEDCLRMVEQVSERYGRLDVLVNNAAIYAEAPPLSCSYEEWVANWEAHLSCNVVGPACLSWCAAKLMASSKPLFSDNSAEDSSGDANHEVEHHGNVRGGVIIGVSSRGAKRGEPCAVAYGASKAALNSMCQSLAQSLGLANIAVAAVSPGFVATDMAESVLAGPRGDDIRAQSPFGRVGEPEDVARVVAFLAEPGSRWLSGSVVDCNGASYLH